MTNGEFPRPERAIVDRLARLPTATIANALDDVGKMVNCPVALRPVAPGMAFAGLAITVEVIAADAGRYTSADFRVGAMIDAALAGDVIVVSAQGARSSIFGGMASLAAKVKGIAGLVVDGGVRDIDEMVAHQFPVFARHTVATTGRTRLKVNAINAPIEVDGVMVKPCDVIVADSTGIVVVPRGEAGRVAELAEGYAHDDATAEKEIRAGLSFSEAMAKFKRI
ncbi:MAG: RraA family protein [Betaproteobacteria bacterium]|nr:MAG: RraA family protein [Betaproteobacteria bacterium]